MRELSDAVCYRLAQDAGLPYPTNTEYALMCAAYAAGYRAAQAEAPPREPTQAMDDAASNVDRRNLPGRFRREVWRAMWDAWANGQTSGAASAVTDGPADARSCTCHPDDNPPRPCPRKYALTECRSAADPADLCAELRATHCSNENLHDNAAYELERLARERDDVCNVLTALRAGRQDFMRRIEGLLARAERAEAERDALREVVRQVLDAADCVLCDPDGRVCISGSDADRAIMQSALNAARAKVTIP